MVFPVVMYGCGSWTIKKAQRHRLDSFELWCGRKLLRVPWTARRSNQSILKEISPEYSLEGLKLKLQYFGYLMRKTYSLGKTVMLEKILESPLDCKKIKPINPKGNQPWIFIGRIDAKAEAPILWPPDSKSQLTGKDPDARNDWRQEEKGMTEDEMVGWHHRLNGHEFEQTLGVGDGQGGLVCCSSVGLQRVRHDRATELNRKTNPVQGHWKNPDVENQICNVSNALKSLSWSIVLCLSSL